MGFNVDSRFYSGFSSEKPLFGVDVVETGDKIFINNLYFIIIFVYNIYTKFDNVPNFIFQCKKNKIRNSKISLLFLEYQKTKQGISNSCFLKFVF